MHALRVLRAPRFQYLERNIVSNYKNIKRELLGHQCFAVCSLRWSSSENGESQNDPPVQSGNDNISKSFINRNPRNLEHMGIDNKIDGWWLQYPRKDYWHKLFFKSSNRNTLAYIQHTNGKVVISASTEEWAIRKHLYSTTDVAAAENIGRVIAQRCLESGITEVFLDTLETPVEGESVSLFVKALTDAGISIEEKEVVEKERDIGTDYERQAELGVEPTKRTWRKRSFAYYRWRRSQVKRVPALPLE